VHFSWGITLLYALAGGCREYSSEPGLSPVHIWFRDIGWIFSCPGGPYPYKFGKIHVVENVEKNFIAPLAQTQSGFWITPAGRESRILKTKPDYARIILDYDLFIVQRSVRFEDKSLLFEDQIISNNATIFKEIRFFNFPIIIDKFEILFSKTGDIFLISNETKERITIRFLLTENESIEKLEKIKTPKGVGQIISSRKKNLSVKKGNINPLCIIKRHT